MHGVRGATLDAVRSSLLHCPIDSGPELVCVDLVLADPVVDRRPRNAEDLGRLPEVPLRVHEHGHHIRADHLVDRRKRRFRLI